ncbi:cbb3-type cytochrome c oxidase subunit I [Bartonella sp. HY329]|uniref:cbb3-type cytochrome c oxidase subunit I n=1 Tax=unclassified Bartonella TaxID=2645622 RepID=UPI0021C880FE|nr:MULTISPECIES: cbb3-type cytochrome c oxidase subunit I [unclassified Bartonella]UXM93960.1 cbb3-type cytochrome c oxidase subunit I [Bartonella sp. HY329]UXN08281.1 cbb3-type cytochrome c oxidase subunit I [Bartonella sp. HY328]
MKTIFSCNHKKIGTNYLVFAIIAGIVGVLLSVAMRLELNEPGIQYFHGLASLLYGYEGISAVEKGREMFALFSSAHALIMIFFMVVPALFGGFANWLLPMMIGCEDMLFPRLNRFAFLLLFPAMFLLVGSLLWVSSAQTACVLMIAMIHLAALSAILTAANFIATILVARAPGMGFRYLPIFVWSVLVSSFLMIICMPTMTAALSSLLYHFGFDSFSMSAVDGKNLQIMLWFYSHPEIFVLILPAFGIISEVVATFANRPLVGRNYVISAMIFIGAAGFLIWAQNLFSASNLGDIKSYFFVALPIIAIPAFVIIGSWLATIAIGHIQYKTPMLWALGFILMFVIGSFSAIHLALNSPVSNGNPAFVSHFHYILSLGAVFAIFAAWYFWFPKISGYELREATGKIHFSIMFIAVNMIFLPQHFQGFEYANNSVVFLIENSIGWNKIITLGAMIGVLSLIVFLYGICEAFWRKKAVAGNPWGEGATTLEWTLPSPAPILQWQAVPVFNKH